jgi:PST family polysaccharide transporter
MRELFGFGASVTGCSVFVAITRSIDQVLIGWLWGPSVLGLYERTTRLLQVPITNIYAPLYAVAMPALSRIAHQPQRYRRAFIEILEKLAMLTMPAAALVIVTADWVVELLFGPGWIESAPLIAFFALAAVYQPSLIASGLLFLTQDRPRDMFHAVMIDSAISIASILAGLPFGAIGVAGSFAVTGLVVRLPVAFWLAARRGPVILSDIYKAVAPSAFAALVVGGFGWCLHRILDGQERPVIANLALIGCAAAVVAVAVFYAVPQSRSTMRNIGQFAQFLRRREPKVQT